MDQAWAIKRTNAASVAGATDAPLAVAVVCGISPSLDRLAVGSRAFARRAWLETGGGGPSRTLLYHCIGDGVPLIAIPLVRGRFGAAVVPGSYWPFRTIGLSDRATADDVAALLSDKVAIAALGPLWRLGPVYRDDDAFARLAGGARRAGWYVIERPAGTSFVLDAAALQAGGPWPRSSTAKTVRRLIRRLDAEGVVTWAEVRGADWSAQAFDDLSAVERESWVGATDLSGAKFENPDHRRIWEHAVRDPALAERLSALILYLDHRPIAFSFDLDCGPLQYGIAAGFDRRFGRFRPSKIVGHRQIVRSLARGTRRFDWGLGDGGYKQEWGAVPGPEAIDCLFVRSRIAAAFLSPFWRRCR